MSHGTSGLVNYRSLWSGFGLLTLLAVSAPMPASAAPNEISIPGDRAFPESITSTSDGTIYIGSMAEGLVFRAAPGAAKAEVWIKPGTNGLLSVLGVLADEKSGTLWACSSDLSGMGVKVGGDNRQVALKSFDLKTGAAKSSYPLPGGKALCNDMVVAADGTLYVTDSLNPHILRLKPGASALEVWAENPLFHVEKGAGLDGIAIGSDGSIVTNTFNGGGLFKVEMKRDGSAGAVTQLKTSRPITLPDGLRKLGNNTFLMIEGEGRLDVVTIDGANAKIDTVKDGYNGPVAVTQIGPMAWVLEGQLTHLFDPKTGKPGPFHATAVAIPAH